jgi:hypothetical protein
LTAPITRIDAIRYARHERATAANFVRPVDDHDVPMPLDYFVWAIHRDGETPVIVDTGFGESAAAARGRIITRPVIEGLRDAGIDALSVEDVILTHLHYDHAGSLSTFPNARFHVQDAELAFATSRQVLDRDVRAPFDGEPVAQLIRKLYADHVVFHDGDAEFAPGIALRLVPGHTACWRATRHTSMPTSPGRSPSPSSSTNPPMARRKCVSWSWRATRSITSFPATIRWFWRRSQPKTISRGSIWRRCGPFWSIYDHRWLCRFGAHGRADGGAADRSRRPVAGP